MVKVKKKSLNLQISYVETFEKQKNMQVMLKFSVNPIKIYSLIFSIGDK